MTVKRFLASLLAAVLLVSTAMTGVVPVSAAEPENDASKYVTLDGDWHYKLYRTYPNMFQYFAYYKEATVKSEDLESAVLPSAETWQNWPIKQMPADDATTGGLLTNEFSPTWSESWVIKNFDLPENFTTEETVTLLMGIIDDNDVVYINGQVVAASGFLDGNGQPTLKIPAAGGFDYKAAAKEDQVKWEKSYWEIQREYTIPANVLVQGGTNEIAVRLYNNNSNGGFYSGQIYALCGNESAVRALKGLPSTKVESPEVMAAVAEQNAALAAGNIEAYAATISDNYHDDALVKADKVAEIKAMMDANSNLVVTDEKAAVYMDEQGGYWYTANRTITSGETVVFSAPVELCFAVDGGKALERGNWNRCYGTSYDSALFNKELTYSVYLPPSYYENTTKHYPVVWLLHGQNSSSTSYRDVDGIGAFMDAQIAAGNITEMVLIMPDSGKNAFYRDSALTDDGTSSGPWRTQLTQELRGLAQENYRILADAKFNGLTGNSMGAYGSLCAGTTNPDLYSSIGLHMGYLPGDAQNNLKALTMEQLAKYDFYLDCGKQDQTVGTSGTIAVHNYLESVEKEHGYDLRDGAHNSAFYMSGMPYSMKMHSDHFLANGLAEVENHTEHQPAAIPAVEATCTATGLTEGGKCTVCGEIVTAQSVIPAKGHSVVVIPGKAATCTATGLTKGSKCSVCGEIIKAQEIIPVKEHTAVVIPGKAAACTATGLTEGSKCSVCGEIIKAQEIIPVKEHTVVTDKAVAPTCTQIGRTEGQHCSVCKTVIVKQETIRATGHNWDNGVITTMPTTTAEGVKTYTCSACKATRTESVPVLNGFVDVPANAWYASAVNKAAALGLMNGVGENRFNPNGTASRAMVVQVLYSMSGSPAVTAFNHPFADVSNNQWYSKAIQWAYTNKITNGISATAFGVNNDVTREQIATFLYSYAGKPAVTGNLDAFKDGAKVSSWAKDAVIWATQSGILSGAPNADGTRSLNPTNLATRAELATLIVGFHDLMNK